MTWLHVANHYIGQVRYGRTIALALLAVGTLAIAVFGYRWWSHNRAERAHATLARAIEIFERAEQENTPALWEEADRAFGQGYTQHAGSSLAAYFLAFQSEIALHQGNTEKAREFLTKALQAMSVSAPFYGSYAVKLALMESDSGKPDLMEKGAKALEQLARNQKNKDRDMALYYQGLLLFQAGDRAGAEQVWQPLVGTRGTDSIWSQAAQARLDYTV